jgi:hypothetical protein
MNAVKAYYLNDFLVLGDVADSIVVLLAGRPRMIPAAMPEAGGMAVLISASRGEIEWWQIRAPWKRTFILSFFLYIPKRTGGLK